MVGHRPLQVAESRFEPGSLKNTEFKISGTAVVAAATAPINRPGDEPEANDHLANIALQG
jgi:hypothetical protein